MAVESIPVALERGCLAAQLQPIQPVVRLLDADQAGNKLLDCHHDGSRFLRWFTRSHRAFPLGVAVSHAPWDRDRGERGRHTKPSDRAALRRTNATHRTAAVGFGENQLLSRTVVRHFLVAVRHCLPGSVRKFPRVLAGRAHTLQLFVFVYAAQTKNTSLHVDRGISGCRTATDWLGCGTRAAGTGGMGTLRDRFFLAVSALHGHRLDVSRRLCARGISRAARRRDQRAFCDLAEFCDFTGSHTTWLVFLGDR